MQQHPPIYWTREYFRSKDNTFRFRQRYMEDRYRRFRWFPGLGRVVYMIPLSKELL